jgi:hypothetical protein
MKMGGLCAACGQQIGMLEPRRDCKGCETAFHANGRCDQTDFPINEFGTIACPVCGHIWMLF